MFRDPSKMFQPIRAYGRTDPAVVPVAELKVVLFFPAVTAGRIQYFLSIDAGFPGFSG
jgi:hypothetical protein